MITAIASFFGMIIRVIYNLVGQDYFLSILLFTLLTKLILFPLSLKQIKSTEEMKKISPEDKKIREKYKNDKTKQSEELTKLYSKHKINPLGGCLPLLIQLPIIVAMFYIVKQPLTYITQTPQDQITAYTQKLLGKEEVTKQEMEANELTVAEKNGLIDMHMIGSIKLSDTPADTFNKDPNKRVSKYTLIIPILALVFSIVQTKVLQRNSTVTDEQKEMQKSMNLVIPLVSAFVSYTMPLALGVYWLFGNILQIGQQFIVEKIIHNEGKKDRLTLDKGGNK